ncbi:MAG: hypothetical protein WCT01_04340 [Candidatus Shapirobacteria bacterium]
MANSKNKIEVSEPILTESCALYTLESGVYVIKATEQLHPSGYPNDNYEALDALDVGKCFAFIRRGGTVIEHVLPLPIEGGEVLSMVVLAKMPKVRGEVEV